MDDLIEHDLPALIDYVKNATGKPSLGYIGHSQGSYMMFNLLSIKPEYSKLVKPFIAISPVSYFTRFESYITYLEPFHREII